MIPDVTPHFEPWHAGAGWGKQNHGADIARFAGRRSLKGDGQKAGSEEVLKDRKDQAAVFSIHVWRCRGCARRVRMRCVHRSPGFSPSVICSPPPISASASGAGLRPSRRALTISPVWRRCSSMLREAAVGRRADADFFDLRALARNAGEFAGRPETAKGLRSAVKFQTNIAGRS